MKTVPVSVRLNEADAEFLASLQKGEASTPSEKLRALLHDERDRVQRNREFEAVRNRIQERVNGTRNLLKAQEREDGLSSILWIRVFEIFPDIATKILTGEPLRCKGDKIGLLEFERDLQQDVFELINEILELALRQEPKVHNPREFLELVQQPLEVLELIQLKHKKLS
jgi:hypothetical protein